MVLCVVSYFEFLMCHEMREMVQRHIFICENVPIVYDTVPLYASTLLLQAQAAATHMHKETQRHMHALHTVLHGILCFVQMQVVEVSAGIGWAMLHVTSECWHSRP